MLRALQQFAGRLLGRSSDPVAQIRSKLAAASDAFYRLGRQARRDPPTPPGRSGDAATLESQGVMGPRVRSAAGNNSQYRRLITSLADLVVGEGIQTFATPFDADADLMMLFDQENDLQALRRSLAFGIEADDTFRRHFESTDFDARGKMAGPDMDHLAFRELTTIGDTIRLRCRRRGVVGPTSLCYQQIEREQLDTSMDRPATGGQNKIVGGIEMDAAGRPVNYHLFDAHPDDPLGAMSSHRSRPVPASRVCHLYFHDRPSQSIGTSWFAPMGQNMLDRDRFVSYELQTALKCALLALIAKLKPNSSTGNFLSLNTENSDDLTDAFGNEEIALGSSPLAIEIEEGEEVTLVESNRPNGNSATFVDILDHDAAAGGGVSYYTYTGRFDKTNYTGFRGATLQENRHTRVLQCWFARCLVLPVRAQFDREAAAAGMYRNVGPSEYVRDLERWQRWDAIGPGREPIDPAREGIATLGRLKGGLSTLKLECARLGLHWLMVLRQLALEQRTARALGLTLDWDIEAVERAAAQLANINTDED